MVTVLVAVLAVIAGAAAALALRRTVMSGRVRDAEVRAAVPGALGQVGLSPKVELKLVRVALGDRAQSVRNAAAWRAGSLGPVAAPLLPDLLRMLDGLDPKDWGRSCVIRALEAMGPAAAPALEALRAEDRAGGR